LSNFHFVACRHLERDRACGFGGSFRGDFVGLEFEERLIFFDRVTVVDVPFGKDAGGDRFAHRRNFDFEERHGK
jgi:hypothetical protein